MRRILFYGIFKDIRDKNNLVKALLLQALLSMPPFAFEDLVEEVLRNLGFENISVTAKALLAIPKRKRSKESNDVGNVIY